eukprot:10842433-Alexandrium_andersonii.AAC.1
MTDEGRRLVISGKSNDLGASQDSARDQPVCAPVGPGATASPIVGPGEATPSGSVGALTSPGASDAPPP